MKLDESICPHYSIKFFLNFKYAKNHGSPIHTGDPLEIGISNIKKPDFGQYWDRVNDTDVPVFWACGVTPQQAVQAARVPLVFTHSPGYMFVTDLKEK